MNNITKLITAVEAGQFRTLLKDIYLDDSMLDYQEKRYVQAMKDYIRLYGVSDVEIYSAPGRSEVGGNHTDHQHGMVLATSINLDAIAVVSKTSDGIVKIVSDGRPMIIVDTADLAKQPKDEGTSLGLVRGVLAGLKDRGHKIGGFKACITSDVLIGAGLSSSAAFETVIGTIISGLYNNMEISMVEIAQVGQYAENVYFGKPCGLMDQMACSVGGLIHIDFKDPSTPIVAKVPADFEANNYSLCIVDTKGSHDDLTDDYAAVPYEVKQVASYFGKNVLREVDEQEFYQNIANIRKVTGDRAVLRAIHFFGDNARVAKQVEALNKGEFDQFLQMVSDSGNSSYKYLQNIYTTKDVQNQSMSIALAVSETVLKDNGVCRVHGGGFAGTIQAFVKNDFVPVYKEALDQVFGEGSCHILKVRKYGGMKVM